MIPLLCRNQLFYYVFCKMFVYLAMSWNGLLPACFGIFI